MGGIYPAAPAQADVDLALLWRFMNDPTHVHRVVQDENANTFIADFLLPRTVETNGSVIYEVADGVYLDREPEVVAPGAQYPRAKPTDGTAAFAQIPKVGIDVPVTDEKLQESKRDEIRRAAQQVGRHVRRKIDTPILQGIGAAVTDTVSATAAWGASVTSAWYDVMRAVAEINEEDEEYQADTVVLTWSKYAALAGSLVAMSDGQLRSGLVQSGTVPVIAGITVVPGKLVSGVEAIVADRQALGARAFRRIPSPEYQGDPANGIETWTRRDPAANDQWLIRGRRPMIGIIQEPRAARKITGA